VSLRILACVLALAGCSSNSQHAEPAPPRPAPGLAPANFSSSDHAASDEEAAEWTASNITDDNADQALDDLEQEIKGDH
jgi:uncharacterized lipoprotein YajG